MAAEYRKEITFDKGLALTNRNVIAKRKQRRRKRAANPCQRIARNLPDRLTICPSTPEQRDAKADAFE